MLKHFFVMPIITSVLIPMVIMDIWMEIYHRICFPLCGIKYVKRSNYILIDRHKLKYLNIFEKIYCVYCGYGNGVVRYWSEIAAETEYYWCGIQHAKKQRPPHHSDRGKASISRCLQQKILCIFSPFFCFYPKIRN